MRLKTIKPSSRWRKYANENCWTIRCPHSNNNLENLKKKLLSFGGWAVCLPRIESDLDKILNRGRRFSGKAKMMRGEPCQCHMNSAALWEENKESLQICTGYALSKDGMWRQHSWCVMKTIKSYKVVETTMPRISYYGYILDDKESFLFYMCNS